MRAQPRPVIVPLSWWVGLAQEPFYAQVIERFPAMSDSREGKQTDGNRGLAELKGYGKGRMSVRMES